MKTSPSNTAEHTSEGQSADGVPPPSVVLTINGGSSSLKFALFAAEDPGRRVLAGRVEGVGRGESRLIVSGDGGQRSERSVEAPDQAAAVRWAIREIEHAAGLAAVSAVGHRVVHGGSRFLEPERVSAAMLDELRRISPFDPDHLPGEIALIEALEQALPGVPQVACFDTSFHRDLPRVARILPIPRRFEAADLRRYGFHGLSYAYLMEELARVAGEGQARGRVVLAHLGAGASLAAVREGRCVDTTMGLTPTSGLVMATRCGDIDPGLPWLLDRLQGITTEQFHRMVNQESGLLGVSETSADVRTLLACREADPRAAEAIDLFCYQTKKYIGAFAAALGGLETLVFSGGIGENSAEIRRGICDGLDYLGITLDEARNQAGAPVISTEDGRATVRVIRTDEEIMIAREVLRVTGRPG